MNSGPRKFLITGLVVTTACLLAAFGTATYFVKSAKPRLETFASTSLGMTVTCRSLQVSFLPPGITARGVQITNQGAVIAQIAVMRARIDLPSLVKGQLLIPVLTVEKPEFTVTRLKDNSWNITPPKREQKKPPGLPLVLPTIDIRDGSLVLRAGETPLEMRGIRLAIRDLVLDGDTDRPMLSRLSMAGDLDCKELQYDRTIVQDFTAQLQGKTGTFLLAPVAFQAMGGSAAGRMEADMSGGIPLVGVHLELSRFLAEEMFASWSNEELLRGELDLALDITTQGASQQELLHALHGTAAMTGRELRSTRLDLDNLLEEFIHSQKFNLVDLGAFMLVGPLGPALTKSYNFTLLANAARGGTTKVRQLVSLWQIDEGRAVARDVALATEENRVAVRGVIDIAANRFRNLEVAVVDAGGCALVRQEMDGPFENPHVKQPGFIVSAAGPIINIFKGARKFITGGECEVFYNGSVAAPGQ